MREDVFYWLSYIVFCNIILFVLVALPWYAVMYMSGWYVFLAIPCTVFGSLICTEVLMDIKEALDE